MGRHADDSDRVRGPVFIPSKAGPSKWRIVVLSPKATRLDRRRVTKWFPTERDAQEVKEQVERGFARRTGTTVAEALTRFERHLADKGTGSISYKETLRRLRLFFPSGTLLVTRVTPELADDYYETFRQRTKRNGDPISVAYHRSALINARSFFKWCARNELAGANPFADVEGVGKRRRGKAQHTGDEARKLYAHCLPLAKRGDKNALAVLMTLLMALRSSDVSRRVVRDVDLDGTVLRVSEGKTEMSNRGRKIPRVLRPMLLALTKGRPPLEPLFKTPYTKSGHHTRRWLEQAMEKLCADASIPYACPHALKGTSGTLLAVTGELADRIADHLSHEDSSTTRKHYVAKGALEEARTARGAAAIMGGRWRPVSGTKTGTRPKKARRK